jgi:O-antigen/teichoic acid export membrane protein
MRLQREAWTRHRADSLIRNAYILTLSSVLASLLGALYWALAAHWYDADIVGRNYAAVSVMMLIAGIGQLNLSNIMIRFVPSAGDRTRTLVGKAYAASVAISLVLASALLIAIPVVSPRLGFVRTAGLGACFILAVAAYAVFNLQDGVLTGLRRPDWVALENGLFALEKIAILGVFVAFGQTDGILVSWMIALALSLIVTNTFVFGRAIPAHARRPRGGSADASGATPRYLAADFVGAMFWLIAVNLPPVIVLNQLGGAAGAYFSVAWLIAFALYTYGSNMGYSLVVEVVHDTSRLTEGARRVFWHAGRILAGATLLIVVGAPWLLDIFGREYSVRGATALRLLTLSAVPNLMTTTVVAISRARRRLRVVVGVLAGLAIMVLGLTELLVPVWGITGAAAAWLIAQCVTAGVLLWRREWWMPSPAVEASEASPGGEAATRDGR